MSDSNVAKSRRSLLLIFAVFILPVVIAKFALDGHWFNYGVTNQGTLQEQQTTLADMGIHLNLDKQWIMLVAPSAECNEHCQQALLTVNNTFVLLGKEMPRVTPVALSQSSLDSLKSTSLRHEKWQVISKPAEAERFIDAHKLLVIDPLGYVVLSYQLPSEGEELTTLGGAILADMKKLLKYSRVG